MCVCVYIYIYYYSRFLLSIITRYRVAKTHRMPCLCRSISAKEPHNLWLMCRKRLAR